MLKRGIAFLLVFISISSIAFASTSTAGAGVDLIIPAMDDMIQTNIESSKNEVNTISESSLISINSGTITIDFDNKTITLCGDSLYRKYAFNTSEYHQLIAFVLCTVLAQDSVSKYNISTYSISNDNISLVTQNDLMEVSVMFERMANE